MTLQALLSCAILGFAYPVISTATTFVQAELLPGDLAATAHFGRSVAANGSILAAGAFTLTAPGSVYVYQRNSDAWNLQTELHAPNPAAQDEFGLSVGTDGTTLVVGARGITYIFANQNGAWNLQGQVAAGGFSVAVSRDTAAIANSTQVIVLRRDSSGAWHTEAILSPGQSVTAVSIDQNTIIAGAGFAAAATGNETGTAFVYVRNGTAWTQQATLSPNDPAAFAMFGFAVSVSGDSAVVGAPGDGTDILNEHAGSAYVYVRNSGAWTQQAEIIGPSEGSNYGTGLALIGNTLCVGAYDDDSTGGSGSAFLYTRNGSQWTQTATLLPQDGVSGQRFANAVAMADANTFVFGSPDSNNVVFGGGAVYVFMAH